MAKKFDAYEELIRNGFEEGKNQFGYDVLRRTFKRATEVAWYGVAEFNMTVEAVFNKDHGAMTVYYSDGGRRPFKEKCHLNDKRAFNAISQTVANKGYEM